MLTANTFQTKTVYYEHQNSKPMTQEEKQLLLADLCARLPYGVKLQIEGLANKTIHDKGIRKLASVLPSRNAVEYDVQGSNYGVIIDLVKPYLRPMSSMTEEEIGHCNYLLFHMEDSLSYYDYLNSIHIDYRGLISMGIAFEAPDGMYN